MFERRFWITHALIPGAIFALALLIIETFELDRAASHALFYNSETHRWLGAGEGAWWARDLLHSGGRWVVRLFGAAALTIWITSYFAHRLRPWRREARFAFVAIALSTGIVGGLKAITNVDCPWDLVEFGGDRPFIHLFEDRPDSLPHAQCFPGAHSSSGFALVFAYFVLRGSSRRKAILALVAALAVGIAFSIGQQARGAHFVSHDLTSAAIVWFVQLLLYVKILRRGPTSSSVEMAERRKYP